MRHTATGRDCGASDALPRAGGGRGGEWRGRRARQKEDPPPVVGRPGDVPSTPPTRPPPPFLPPPPPARPGRVHRCEVKRGATLLWGIQRRRSWRAAPAAHPSPARDKIGAAELALAGLPAWLVSDGRAVAVIAGSSPAGLEDRLRRRGGAGRAAIGPAREARRWRRSPHLKRLSESGSAPAAAEPDPDADSAAVDPPGREDADSE